MRIAVLGVGLIGGSVGLAAKERLGCEVVGWSRTRTTVDRALELGAIDAAPGSLEAACEGAEVVFCAAPVSVLPQQVAAALAAAGPDAVVTDAGSTKRQLVATLGDDERFVGGHPLAGAETAGVENARANLFEGARWYLTPTERSSGILYDRLQRTIAGLGARPQAIDAEAHDRLMATVSHLPHVLANVLASQAAAELTRDSERMPEAGPSFRDATRVAGSNPSVWGDIYAANAEAVTEAIDDAIARLNQARELVRAAEPQALAAWHAAAAADRRGLLEADRAAGPLREVRVVVANKPGTVAELALALGNAGLNIEDMALHPAEDMRSGAISLWLSGTEQAERAAALVRELGHTATVLDEVA